MRITVIIPAYNCEKYIRQSVESVLEQPYKNIRVIIVNDGSTDNTPAIIDGICSDNENVSCIHKKNGGVSSARNCGIQAALASMTDEKEFLAFLDSDDVWVPGAVTEEIISKNSGSDMISFGGVFANSNLSRYKNLCISKTEEVLTPEQYRHYPPHFCTKLYSTVLFLKFHIAFAEDLSYGEDQIFQHLCVSLSERISVVPILLHVYRNSGTSLMAKAKKIDPVKYFSSIINGWLSADAFMNNADEQNKNHTYGHVLAAIYMLEMIKFSAGTLSIKKVREAVFTVKNHSAYDSFVNLRKKDVSEKQFNEHRFFTEHPYLFIIKNMCFGLAEKIIRTVIGLPVIKTVFERKEYNLLLK